MVVGSGVEASSRRCEVALQNVRGLVGCQQPALVEIALEEIEERLEPERVILEHRGHLCPPAAPHREVASVRAEVFEKKPARGLRHPEAVIVVERPMRPREGRYRECVPGQEDLVVKAGTHSPGAPGQEPLPRGGESGSDLAGRKAEALFEGRIRCHPSQDGPAFPVPAGANVIGGAEERGVFPQDFLDFRGRPGVVPPLFSLGVGVESRVEGPARVQHFALHPVENAARIFGEPGI